MHRANTLTEHISESFNFLTSWGDSVNPTMIDGNDDVE